MRFILLILLVALAVVLVLHTAKSRTATPAEESAAVLDRTRTAVLPSQLQQVEEALNAYAEARSAYPGDLAKLIPAYLRSADLLTDPWGTRLRLENDPPGRAFLVCAGPDRSFATADDTRRSL
jgi:hypothetical protein